MNQQGTLTVLRRINTQLRAQLAEQDKQHARELGDVLALYHQYKDERDDLRRRLERAMSAIEVAGRFIAPHQSRPVEIGDAPQTEPHHDAQACPRCQWENALAALKPSPTAESNEFRAEPPGPSRERVNAWEWDIDVAIFRACRRCQNLLPIGHFQGNAHICRPCVQGKRFLGNAGSRMRNLTITDKGREMLEHLAYQDRIAQKEVGS